MNIDQDGLRINKDCGSTHPGAVGASVVAESADMGVAHDGDGDRVIMVDREGRRVSGDVMLYVLASVWPIRASSPEALSSARS